MPLGAILRFYESDYLNHFDYSIPLCMLSDTESINQNDFDNLINETNNYSQRMENVSTKWIQDIGSGYKHHDIHCITFTNSVSSIIGMTLEQFGILFNSLLPHLRDAFPHSPVIIEADDFSKKICSIRFKLFLTLYRLKIGCSYHLMEKLFGWSKSSICEWFTIVIKVMYNKMNIFHVNFLYHVGTDFQNYYSSKWSLDHSNSNNVDLFKTRIYNANRTSTVGIIADPTSKPIGAVDGTYSIRPRIEANTLINNGEDSNIDKMYTEYKKCHAYKLLIISSLYPKANGKKFILWIDIGCGSCSDSSKCHYLLFMYIIYIYINNM